MENRGFVLYCFLLPRRARLNHKIPFDTGEYLSKLGCTVTPLAAVWNLNACFVSIFRVIDIFLQESCTLIHRKTPPWESNICFTQEIVHHIPIIFQISESVLSSWCFLSFSFNLLRSIFVNISSNLRRLISLQTYSWIIYYYILHYYSIIILTKTLVLPNVLSDPKIEK